MNTSNFAVFGFSLVAGAALFTGCIIEDAERPTPANPEAELIQLIDVQEDGGACLRVDNFGAVQCFRSEVDADAHLADMLPIADDDPGEPLAAPPGCVHTSLNDSGWTDHLRVTNNCSSTVRVKVVLAFGTDFPCYTFGPGSSRNYSWGYPRRFDRLEAC